jgi:hypothetical protein
LILNHRFRSSLGGYGICPEALIGTGVCANGSRASMVATFCKCLSAFRNLETTSCRRITKLEYLILNHHNQNLNLDQKGAGRGAKPRWLVAAIKGGKKLDDFLIEKSGQKGRRKRRSKR